MLDKLLEGCWRADVDTTMANDALLTTRRIGRVQELAAETRMCHPCPYLQKMALWRTDGKTNPLVLWEGTQQVLKALQDEQGMITCDLYCWQDIDVVFSCSHLSSVASALPAGCLYPNMLVAQAFNPKMTLPLLMTVSLNINR
ncbi:hypothetical protein NDU88_001798 [Pleurodeles waltl]|uniref:Uncharacterized protein n=1 Tax=Pleurodeles waltl TaxID=8319 RepID=A0AAV7S921_PLEWA|nr:hypothetical protein NDU88_001798 [Pleurodeles waltl]